MRTDDPKMQVEQPKIPEALRNSTLAERKRAREGKRQTKAVQSAENKAVKGDDKK